MVREMMRPERQPQASAGLPLGRFGAMSTASFGFMLVVGRWRNIGVQLAGAVEPAEDAGEPPAASSEIDFCSDS